MKEVLSQEEIDMLLNALSSGELDSENLENNKKEKEVIPYDFRRPNKFSKEHLRTLYFIHDNLSRLMSNFLSGYLRSNIQIQMASVDQMTYEDFIVSIPTPTLITSFAMEPLPGALVMESNSAFLFPILDLLFGGNGDMPPKVRELTDIELKVMRNLNSKLLENLHYVWSDIYDITVKIQNLETNPQLSQTVSPNETVAVVTLSTKINGNQGLVNLCLPYLSLETVISKLSAQHWFSGLGIAEEGNRQRITKHIKRSPVKITALVGETEIKVKDFLQLQAGDVITMDRRLTADMDLLIENRKKFKIQPGLLGKNLAVQVTGGLSKGGQK